MTAQIQSLIDKVDSFELIRDEIAAILKVEQASQQVLATAASRDPRLWALRVFLERSNPWAEFVDDPAQVDATPLINVSYDSTSFDMSKGNVVERQTGAVVYNIDCYGYGISEATNTGHLAGDERSAVEAQRAVRLARNILMASSYVHLAHTGLVGRRWIQSITMFQPSDGDRHVQHVCAARISLEVMMNEFAPQYVGQALELVSAKVHRSDRNEVLIAADYGA